MLVYTLMAVLVVDAASLTIRQGFICLGDLDECLMGRFVPPTSLMVKTLKVNTDEWYTYGFLSG